MAGGARRGAHGDCLMADVTLLLSAIDSGDPLAAEQLLTLVYDDLRRLAAHRLAISFMARNGEASASVPRACTGGMPGCGSRAVIFDSRTKRSLLAPGSSTLRATSRSRGKS